MLGIASRAVGLFAMVFVILASSGCGIFLPPVPREIPIYLNQSFDGTFRAGAATVDITPSGSVWMGGFGILRSSKGVHDPLFARALVLEQGNFRLAIVAVDLVGIQRQDLLNFFSTIKGFPPGGIIICSTHNHSGPDTLGPWGLPPFFSGQDPDYMQKVFCGIRRALQEAQENLREAEFAATAIVINPAGIMKNIRRPGMLDRELVALHLRELRGGKTIATLVELGCHPEALGPANRFLTADFPGWTVRRLEEKLGGVGIYVSGSLGGLVTADVPENGAHPADSWLESEKLGLRVADIAIDRLKNTLRYDSVPSLTVWHAPFYVQSRNFFYSLLNFTEVVSRDLYRGGYVLSEVNVWEFGNLRIVTVPGEITPDLGLRIKKAVAGNPVMIIGLANDELGYFMPESDFSLNLYSYERIFSPGRDVGDIILRRIEDIMLMHEQLKRKDFK